MCDCIKLIFARSVPACQLNYFLGSSGPKYYVHDGGQRFFEFGTENFPRAQTAVLVDFFLRRKLE